jgi:3-hydroxyisobutyrate dehydrogenase-like beta-hydroxyacid dehydrogenase
MSIDEISPLPTSQQASQRLNPNTIGFVGFGQVAGCLAAALAQHGVQIVAYDVLLDQPHGIDEIRQRALGVNVQFMPLAPMLAQTGMVLSTVTTDVALAAAKACARHLRRGHVFIDLNATSPAIKRAVADALAPTGADFVEGAILGAIGVTGAQTRILVCGHKAAWAAEEFSRLGLNVGFYGAEIGRASTFKLLRSVFSKGMEALLLESLLAARRAGVEEDIWREIVTTLDERPFAEIGGNWMRTHGSAHARRYHEMVQVEELLRELDVEPLLTNATTRFFERSTRLALSQSLQKRPAIPEDVVAALDHLLRKHTSQNRV